MQKVKEERDTSKEILAINIESEIFKSMLNNFNKEIRRCVRDVLEEKFEAGEITLKLNIEIPHAYEVYPAKDKKNGVDMTETYAYRKPNFEYKLGTVLKQQYKSEGQYTDRRDVQFIDGEFVAVPIKQAQMHMSDLAEKLVEAGASVER